MVIIRTIEERDLPTFGDLHNGYLNREESIDTVRDWFRTNPELCFGAVEDGALIGHCLGRPRSDCKIELVGIVVKQAHQCGGIGSALLDEFEERAAEQGFERVEIGSAGGYVDDFYHDRGYEPESALVRLDPDESIPVERLTAHDVLREMHRRRPAAPLYRCEWIGRPPDRGDSSDVGRSRRDLHHDEVARTAG